MFPAVELSMTEVSRHKSLDWTQPWQLFTKWILFAAKKNNLSFSVATETCFKVNYDLNRFSSVRRNLLDYFSGSGLKTLRWISEWAHMCCDECLSQLSLNSGCTVVLNVSVPAASCKTPQDIKTFQ